MKQIIPTIFALDKETFSKKLKVLSKFSKTIHLDICDSKFVKSKTINLSDMVDILKFKKINFEVHLMVKNPIKYLNDLNKLNIKEIFIHQEIFQSFNEFILIKKQFEKNKIKVNLVINPKTQIEEIIIYLSQIEKIMLMSVEPGAEGQKFIEKTDEKIKQLKLLKSNLIIQIDGGINKTIAKKLISKGVSNLCIGSYISSSKTPKENFENLQTLIK